MYALLGWINVALFVTLLLPYLLRKLNQLAFGNKNKTIPVFLKQLRKVHKPLGVVLLISAAVHGYMALGAIRLHTGTVLFISLFFTAMLGGMFYRYKKKKLFFYHRALIALSAALLLVHLFFSSLIYQLFN